MKGQGKMEKLIKDQNRKMENNGKVKIEMRKMKHSDTHPHSQEWYRRHRICDRDPALWCSS